MTPLLPFVLTLSTSAAAALPQAKGHRRLLLGMGMTLASLAAMVIAVPVLFDGNPVVYSAIRIDRFAAYMATLVAVVAGIATFAGINYLNQGLKGEVVGDAEERTFCAFFPLFVLSMWTAVVADNLILLWIALEATTLTTTLLVAFDKSRGAVEAAWKYILICSTGITLGLLGVLMVIHSAGQAGLGDGAHSLATLLANATRLSPEALRWGFVFLFIGVGTKVGLVPMHTWLPDAHGKTPSPISAVLSGILLNVALSILIRFKMVTDAALGGTTWTGRFFLVFGIASIVLSAFVIIVQANYKRLLAYSSIEHMGLVAFAVGLGPVGLLPALVHMAGHAFAKPALFVGAGEILHEFHSTKTANIKDFLGRRPKTAVLFVIALLALLAAPPSALFISEIMIIGGGMVAHPWLTVVVAGALVVVAFGMMRQVVSMVYSSPAEALEPAGQATPPIKPAVASSERWGIANISMALNVGLCAALGLALMTAPGHNFFLALTASLH